MSACYVCINDVNTDTLCALVNRIQDETKNS